MGLYVFHRPWPRTKTAVKQDSMSFARTILKWKVIKYITKVNFIFLNKKKFWNFLFYLLSYKKNKGTCLRYSYIHPLKRAIAAWKHVSWLVGWLHKFYFILKIKIKIKIIVWWIKQNYFFNYCNTDFLWYFFVILLIDFVQ